MNNLFVRNRVNGACAEAKTLHPIGGREPTGGGSESIPARRTSHRRTARAERVKWLCVGHDGFEQGPCHANMFSKWYISFGDWVTVFQRDGRRTMRPWPLSVPGITGAGPPARPSQVHVPQARSPSRPDWPHGSTPANSVVNTRASRLRMSKLSFRARALDASKPMPIYMAEELPDLPDYSAINRAVPQMPSGMEKEEECVSRTVQTSSSMFSPSAILPSGASS